MTRAKFDEYDVDKSGCLNWDEIQKCLSDLNLLYADARVLMILNDKDSSLSLDWEEFQSFMSQAAWSNRMIDHVPLEEIVLVSYEIFSKEEAKHRKTWLVSEYQADNSSCFLPTQQTSTQQKYARMMLRQGRRAFPPT